MPLSREKKKAPYRHVERRGHEELENISEESQHPPSLPLQFSYSLLGAWQNRNATDLAHCSAGAQGTADYTLAAV